jgi:hypothetical protein
MDAVECDRTGVPCAKRAVGLDPGNVLAWTLYHEARLEGVGPLILELRQIELTGEGADDLADKLATIGRTYSEIERDEIKRQRDEIELRRRQRGSRA